ncbi:hypothetical protein JW905_18790 [bacterium]|nr:hypothetical protein [candidate division CSSED10-310 bacterium]
MERLPEPIVAFLEKTVIAGMAPAYLRLDADLHPAAWSESLARYGISSLDRTRDVRPQAPVFEGLLPLTQSPSFLSCLRIEDGTVANIHLFTTAGDTWVLFLDATAEAAQRWSLQQESNELQLLQEQQGKLLARLARANDELNDFAFIVSHDLKAPLRAIGSLAQWIGKDYTATLPAEGREMLQLMEERVETMHTMIDGVLRYSRLTRLREERQQTDLGVMVREVIAALAPPPSVRIETGDSFPTVLVEATRMYQVFQNLLSNALKYVDERNGHIRIWCEEDEEEWRLVVTDNGPGVPEVARERIFKIFRTAGLDPVREGTGLGLSIAKKVVEMYDGRIWVENAPGGGAMFQFTLNKKATRADGEKPDEEIP